MAEDALKLVAEKGPWVYELFAVLIHSGSALGGHYYAHIKSLGDSGETLVRVGGGVALALWCYQRKYLAGLPSFPLPAVVVSFRRARTDAEGV